MLDKVCRLARHPVTALLFTVRVSTPVLAIDQNPTGIRPGNLQSIATVTCGRLNCIYRCRKTDIPGSTLLSDPL